MPGEGAVPEEPIIRVEQLSVGYAGWAALEGVTLAIRRGEIVSIVGPSGSGKTTLLRVIAGLLPPWKGRVFIAGRELTGQAPDTLSWVHQHLGVVFQSGALLGSYTVGQNIALPLEEFTNLPRSLIDRTVRLKLDLVRLGGYGETRPGQLSGGMRKRAALARAMALDPEILLCDEPSAGLDPGTALQIDELLMELNASLGVTVVVVTHDLTTLEHLAHRCVMLNGEARGIIAAGSVDELRGSPDPRVQAFFGRPPACQETPR